MNPMHLPTFYFTFIGLLQLSNALFDSETVRGYPCIKRNNEQIYCPMAGSRNSNVHRAAASNSSIKLGPSMYYRRFTVPVTVLPSTTTTTTAAPTSSKINTHVIYYTKQYDEKFNGQNAFDLNDEEEHAFMHGHDVEENVIDDGKEIKTIKKRRINNFIEDNKAMIRRMFGDDHNSGGSLWLHPDGQQHYSSFHVGPEERRRLRRKRKIGPTPLSSNKVDSCESTVEIVTPYWASNSGGKIRAIVNTQHLQQAIQQEVCQAVQTKRCNDDCTCEQKYKWHRLLAYDPEEDCKGIFMDWFLFPSCCVCRCSRY